VLYDASPGDNPIIQIATMLAFLRTLSRAEKNAATILMLLMREVDRLDWNMLPLERL
jgi:hypothetical protein